MAWRALRGSVGGAWPVDEAPRAALGRSLALVVVLRWATCGDSGVEGAPGAH